YRPLRRGEPLPFLQVLRLRGYGGVLANSLGDARGPATAAPLRRPDSRSQRCGGPSALARRRVMDAQQGRSLGRLLGLRGARALTSRTLDGRFDHMAASGVTHHATGQGKPPARFYEVEKWYYDYAENIEAVNI